jgi:hypothetical protein
MFGAEVGITYCGIICVATGGQAGGHAGGQAVAANGAAYIGAGGQQTGAGAGGHGAGRLHQLQGHNGHSEAVGQHAAQPPNMAGIVATASKASIFFIILCLLRKQSRITAWVESSEYPIQTLNGRESVAGSLKLGTSSTEFIAYSVLTSLTLLALLRSYRLVESAG